jgi:hypothetical protein
MLTSWTAQGSLSAMANYFLHVKIFGRGKGSKATKAAAYRAGARIHDERTNALYNYTSRTDVAHAEIVLPTEFADRSDMEWALDRSTLWNAAEHAGRQWNSRLAREILVHLPLASSRPPAHDRSRGRPRRSGWQGPLELSGTERQARGLGPFQPCHVEEGDGALKEMQPVKAPRSGFSGPWRSKSYT